MHLFRSIGMAAVVFASAASAIASPGVTISGSGMFGSSVTASALVQANTSFFFSFSEANPITDPNPFGGTGSGSYDTGSDFFVPYAGNLVYSLNGTVVQTSGPSAAATLTGITFYDDGVGGMDIAFKLADNSSLTLSFLTPGDKGLVCDSTPVFGNPEDIGNCTKGTFKLTNGTAVDVSLTEGDDLAGSGTLTIATQEIAQPGATVPEPAGWVLMITGFGLVGGAMRRRGAALATA